MVVGKNKRMSKGGKKGGKKKVIDPFTKKDWYDIRAPGMFKVRQVGKTLVTKTIGNKIAADGLKHRVYEVNQEDLQQNDGNGFRKFKLICEDVQGKNCITNFYGMSLTRNKSCEMIKKRHTMISANIDVKTTDNYHLRVFAQGFTQRDEFGPASTKYQKKVTTYAQAHQVKQIRKLMVDTITKIVSSGDVQALVNNLLIDVFATDITKQARPIYPLQDVNITKVKVIKKPKLDLQRLAEIHGSAVGKVNAKGERVDRPDAFEPAVVDNV